ncbi:DUF4102 domain-containing protein [Sulfidibacter corallicola]|uniref:DUF4102 domain-containing protein n=1 Tax=Sulfidibacter corallicola TaxID=2818388 RepID=A0A8A4TNS9_SULCO|nr:Arm DNA-binding domain-containing protein [Sulfidibacter corallicola]QTD50752.1 DUF4102 domain-containing protein [Sulfidibacter corallicola]
MKTKAIRFNKTNLSSFMRDFGNGETFDSSVKDTEVSGLKFRVGLKRSVFQFEKRISGRKGSPVTLTIGAFPAVSIEEARQEARRLANLCERGIDPREEKKQRQAAKASQRIMLKDAVDEFFAIKEKKKLAPMTLKKYRNVITHQFAPNWMSRDIRSITPEMIEAQFYLVQETARERCFEMLKVFGNIWTTCAPIFKDSNEKRLLGTSPIPEVRELLDGVQKNRPNRPVIPSHLLGKFVVTLERLRDGFLSVDANNETNTLIECPAIGVITKDDITASGMTTSDITNDVVRNHATYPTHV